MLFMLGPVEFDVAPLNARGSKFKADFDFAEHKVLGAAPVYENMGTGEKVRTIKGTTFPNSDGFEGGIDTLRALESMRLKGEPQHLIRGDGTTLGWYLITSLTIDEDHLDPDGVPGEMKFELSLTFTEAPSVTEEVTIEITIEVEG